MKTYNALVSISELLKLRRETLFCKKTLGCNLNYLDVTSTSGEEEEDNLIPRSSNLGMLMIVQHSP